MSLKKLKEEADRQETSDFLKQDYEAARKARREHLIQACSEDFSEVLGKEKFALSLAEDRSVVASYKSLKIALHWPSLDECPLDVFFRFSIVKNSGETVDLIVVELITDGHGKAIPRNIESQAVESTFSQLRTAIKTIHDAPLSFRIARNFHPKTAVGDPPGEQAYHTFKSALAALAAVL